MSLSDVTKILFWKVVSQFDVTLVRVKLIVYNDNIGCLLDVLYHVKEESQRRKIPHNIVSHRFMYQAEGHVNVSVIDSQNGNIEIRG